MLSVGRVMEQSAVTYQTAPKSAEQISEKKTTTLASDATDQFIKSGATFTPAYTKATVTDNKSNMARSGTDPDSNIPPEKLKEKEEKQQLEEKTTINGEQQHHAAPHFESVAQAKSDIMRDMVMQTLSGQIEDSHKTGAMKELEEIISSFAGDDEVPPDENYWGSDETSARIVAFAGELTGRDFRSYNTLKDAVDRAFLDTELNFGGRGSLPPVCYETYDKVRRGFFEWAKQLSQRGS